MRSSMQCQHVTTIPNTCLWLAMVVLLPCLSANVQAENWTNWRGPYLNGTVAPGVYPVEWSDKTNVAWTVPLPGKSSSTPIVWKDKIVLTSPIDGQNGVIGLDRSGKELWKVTLGDERGGKHKKASGSNPSPLTDGDRIYVYFKSGDFAALDWSGKTVWHKNLQKEYGEDTLWWDLGTSPVLTSKHVVVACMQSGPSYLAAFDPATGKEVWKVARILDAPEESSQSYTTPVVTTYKGQEQIIVLGADYVTCHDASNGQELWRVGTLNPGGERFFRSISSPVVVNDVVIAPYARGKSLTAIRMGGAGDVTQSHVLWTKTFGADVPTPAAIDGKVYIASDKGALFCVDAQSGEELWTETLEKNRNAFSASPIVAGNLLYFLREDGKTFVVDLVTKTVKADNSLGDDVFAASTPVLVDQEILLRTNDKLFCIQAPQEKVSLRSDAGNQ